MTKYILHGGYTSTKNEDNHTFYLELANSAPQDGNILLVYFSREKDDVSHLVEQDRGRIIDRAGEKKLNIKRADEKNFLNDVRWADVIYMRGGNTRKLIDTIKEYPDFHERINGKTVAGSSAGAYLISTYYYLNSSGKVHEGLALAPLRVACHVGSEIHPNVGKDPRKMLDQYSDELELVLLKDFEWRKFNFE